MGEEDKASRDKPFDAVAAKRHGEELARKLWPTVRDMRGAGDLPSAKAVTGETTDTTDKETP